MSVSGRHESSPVGAFRGRSAVPSGGDRMDVTAP